MGDRAYALGNGLGNRFNAKAHPPPHPPSADDTADDTADEKLNKNTVGRTFLSLGGCEAIHSTVLPEKTAMTTERYREVCRLVSRNLPMGIQSITSIL